MKRIIVKSATTRRLILKAAHARRNLIRALGRRPAKHRRRTSYWSRVYNKLAKKMIAAIDA